MAATAVTKYDPELFVNSKALGTALADSLSMFSLDLVGVVAGYLINTQVVLYGQAELESLFGRAALVGVPDLPDDLEAILASECPFTKKCVGEVSKLVLFMSHIGDKSTTLRELPEIFTGAHGILDKHAERRKPLKYSHFDDRDMKTHGYNVRPASFWGLVMINPPDMRHYEIGTQKYFIREKGRGLYRMLPLQELVYFAFLDHAHTGAFLPIGHDDRLRCPETSVYSRLGGSYLSVASFGEDGMQVVSGAGATSSCVGLLRKLKAPDKPAN